MGDEKCVVDAYNQMKQHYEKEMEIDRDLVANLIQEIEKFKGSEHNVTEIKDAISQLEGSDDDERSASATGTIFQRVATAFRSFSTKYLTNENIRHVGRRVGEEMYANVGEYMIEQKRQQQSSPSQQPIQPSDCDRASEGQTSKSVCAGHTFIKDMQEDCLKKK